MNIPLEGAGKGDTPKPINKKIYNKNYDKTFKDYICVCCGEKFTWENLVKHKEESNESN